MRDRGGCGVFRAYHVRLRRGKPVRTVVIRYGVRVRVRVLSSSSSSLCFRCIFKFRVFFLYFISRLLYVCFSVCRFSFSPRFACYSSHRRFRSTFGVIRGSPPPAKTFGRHRHVLATSVYRGTTLSQFVVVALKSTDRSRSVIRNPGSIFGAQTSEYQSDMWAKSAAGRLIVVGSLLVLVTGRRNILFIIGNRSINCVLPCSHYVSQRHYTIEYLYHGLGTGRGSVEAFSIRQAPPWQFVFVFISRHTREYYGASRYCCCFVFTLN